MLQLKKNLLPFIYQDKIKYERIILMNDKL